MADRLNPGERLELGQHLESPNGKYQLRMQADGNLVLYRMPENAPIWNSNSWNKPTKHAIMQEDGNFVVYGPRPDVEILSIVVDEECCQAAISWDLTPSVN